MPDGHSFVMLLTMEHITRQVLESGLNADTLLDYLSSGEISRHWKLAGNRAEADIRVFKETSSLEHDEPIAELILCQMGCRFAIDIKLNLGDDLVVKLLEDHTPVWLEGYLARCDWSLHKSYKIESNRDRNMALKKQKQALHKKYSSTGTYYEYRKHESFINPEATE